MTGARSEDQYTSAMVPAKRDAALARAAALQGKRADLVILDECQGDALAKAFRAPWTVQRMSGFRISHPFIVTNPACPEGRHPTFGGKCGCKVFRTEAEAQAYADERTNQ